jgi:N-acetylglucosaminyl-diphospho-decaprenol L-rhamnosyltransferase
MRICAIVLDYRRADLTARCIASLAPQVEHMVVVDNGGGAAPAQPPGAGFAGTAAATTLLSPGRNLGFAAGVNHALRATASLRHDAYLLLNNDATLGPGAVAQLVRELALHGGRALVAPARTSAGMPLRLWYQPALGLVTRGPLPGSFAYLSGACLLVPATLAQPALFDEAFFMYGEDVELAWRVRRQGVELATVEGAVLHHAGGTTARRGGAFYEFHMARAHLLLARKLARSRPQRWLFLAGRAATLPARAALRALRYRSRVPLSALARAATGPGDPVTAP